MLPVVLAPTYAQTPQVVDMSPLVGQASDAALGRLPTHAVPQPVSGGRVGNEQRGGQQRDGQRGEPLLPAVPQEAALTLAGNAGSEIRLSGPVSTTFLAQLLGQLGDDAAEQANIKAIWLGAPQQRGAGFVDYERLEEYGQVKYAPSGAGLSLSASAETRDSAAPPGWLSQAVAYRRSLRRDDTASVFTNGLTAYASTQGRYLAQAAHQAQEYSYLF